MILTGAKITCFEAKDKRQIVWSFYENENLEWHKITHKRCGTVKENVQDTLDSISENSVMYQVMAGGKLAAFFVRYEDENGQLAMEGFHIDKRFRKGWFFIEFWDLVRRMFGREFFIGICQSNEQAISHLLAQGFLIVNKKVHDNKTFFILKSN
jgi:hypothetical protein